MSFDLRIKEGDLAIGSDGDLEILSGVEKLVQDVLKILQTPLGGNPFFPWYGSLVSTALVGSVMDFRFTETAAQQQIRSNLETLQRLQRQQLSNGQKVTADEQLAAVQSVVVKRNTVDPTYFSEASQEAGLEIGNIVIFRIVNGDQEKFLHLYNVHNGYYSHNVEFTNNNETLHHGDL